MHLIPKTATWTPFRASIPAISHFVRLGFSPEKREKVLKKLSISTKNAVVDVQPGSKYAFLSSQEKM